MHDSTFHTFQVCASSPALWVLGVFQMFKQVFKKKHVRSQVVDIQKSFSPYQVLFQWFHQPTSFQTHKAAQSAFA